MKCYPSRGTGGSDLLGLGEELELELIDRVWDVHLWLLSQSLLTVS